MTAKIVFTDTAKSDLRELAVYLAEVSKDRDLAIRFVKRLQEKTKVLEDFPQSGAVPRDRVLKSNGGLRNADLFYERSFSICT